MLKKDETIAEIGKRFRRRNENITHEPLPRRWVDLIHYLNEKSQNSQKRGLQSDAEPRRRRA